MSPNSSPSHVLKLNEVCWAGHDAEDGMGRTGWVLWRMAMRHTCVSTSYCDRAGGQRWACWRGQGLGIRV